jgi:ribose 5-phosphate isomerase B
MTKPKLAIAADHAGIHLKAFLIEQMKEVEFIDMGTKSTTSVDYPDFAEKACQSITSGLVERAILVCGSGIGVSIAANKIHGIRAAHVESSFTARLAAEHNKANVLCLGERITGNYHALECARAWLSAKFEERHQKRIDKITQLEK